MAGPHPQNVTRTCPKEGPLMETTREEKPGRPKATLRCTAVTELEEMGHTCGVVHAVGRTRSVEVSRCSLMPHRGGKDDLLLNQHRYAWTQHVRYNSIWEGERRKMHDNNRDRIAQPSNTILPLPVTLSPIKTTIISSFYKSTKQTHCSIIISFTRRFRP